MLGRLLIALIYGYRWCISPLLGERCRFYPSCSCYAYEAIAQFGAIRGAYKAMRRLLRCHPWNDGGYDPLESAIHPADGQHRLH